MTTAQDQGALRPRRRDGDTPGGSTSAGTTELEQKPMLEPRVSRRRTVLPTVRDRLSLGETSLPISPLCLGFVSTPETVCAAFDQGINFFFLTADLHWPRYEMLRRGLELLFQRGRSIRDQVIVGVCSYTTQPEFPVGAMTEVVEAVPGLEHVDVAIAGGAYGHELLHRYRVFERVRKERHLGARAIGCTFHDRPAAATATSHGLFDIAYARYNPIHSGARVDLFPYLTRPTRCLLFNFKSTFGYVDDARWRELELPDLGWRPRITDYYRFALARPEIDGLLCAPQNVEQVESMAAALEEGPLTEEEERLMLDLGKLVQQAIKRR